MNKHMDRVVSYYNDSSSCKNSTLKSTMSDSEGYISSISKYKKYFLPWYLTVVLAPFVFIWLGESKIVFVIWSVVHTVAWLPLLNQYASGNLSFSKMTVIVVVPYVLCILSVLMYTIVCNS
jgi:hypothetical protein